MGRPSQVEITVIDEEFPGSGFMIHREEKSGPRRMGTTVSLRDSKVRRDNFEPPRLVKSRNATLFIHADSILTTTLRSPLTEEMFAIEFESHRSGNLSFSIHIGVKEDNLSGSESRQLDRPKDAPKNRQLTMGGMMYSVLESGRYMFVFWQEDRSDIEGKDLHHDEVPGYTRRYRMRVVIKRRF